MDPAYLDLPQGSGGFSYKYGTAGFRLQASLLPPVVFRVGMVAALRSQYLGGQTIGVMITASHNPPADNGVKLIDPQGEMLETSWEAYATEFANAPTDADLVALHDKVCKTLRIPESESRVVYARDTRSSGPVLAEALKAGLDMSDAISTDYGVLTTPQLHYIVRCLNTADSLNSYGVPSEKGYYEKLSRAFKTLMQGKLAAQITVDCANGVGAPKLGQMASYIGSQYLSCKIINDQINDYDTLNCHCGADYVKTQQRAPRDLHPVPLKLYASFDGDADRVVFFFVDKDDKFRLLDGDKIASLAAMFISDLLRDAGISDKLVVGVVQTAYANGNATNFVRNSLKLPVECTPTGVKHLHHAAQRFDVGIYFEANGHGTILFSPDCISLLQSYEASSPAQKTALDLLLALVDVVNQTVGDAISDLLLILAILSHKNWGPLEWDSAYTDLPNRLIKVVVKDMSIFRTQDAERRLVSPPELQDKIDGLVKKYKQGRSFVRASGTENAVRVYAEASTRVEADELGLKVADLLIGY